MTAVCYGVVVTALPSAATTQSTPIPVVGVKPGIDRNTGQPPARLNVNDLYARGGPHWHLYILALSSLQAVNETEELSYFKITGIHGLPYSAWNGVEQVPGAPTRSGYCPHGELLFSTWHRPFVALFEQALVSHAVEIASRYPSSLRAIYQAAAETLRQPYWDWAFDKNLPTAVLADNVTVIAPGGQMNVPNPLYSYRFQRESIEAGFPGGLSKYSTTIRCLGNGGQANNASASNARMGKAGRSLLNLVYDVFTRSTSFDTMAYLGSGGPSFENPHNFVHNNAGCGGTMGDIRWSAFDPLFMLHHTNLDRLIAMWQAIHYNSSMFTTTGVSNGQFATPPGAVTTPDSPLKPFFDENGNFHTSNSVRNITTFGYTYPEINDWSKTPDQLATYVRAQVNRLYGPESTGGQPITSPTSIDGKKHYGAPPPAPPAPGRYYTASLQVNRSDIPLPLTVNLAVSRITVGSLSLLSMPCEGMASASIALQDVVVLGDGSGGLNVTIQSMTAEKARSYLQQSLSVDIRMNDGTTVPVSKVQSLQIQVEVMDFFAPAVDHNGSASAFPSFGNVTTRWPVRLQQNANY
ncbi:hypothetical protein B0H66DRAFT_576217 [Apodospora peruviana]|uniref:Tyrosinase copper-binding domain-containing protein n=1 Tax=Apodospora peruviana TaxID=516989 RepID=A0AAE0I0E2_9PEZI|nr:hypothetical protein B0H66DRAFT_576217 [Apodospora peruviana]